MTKKPIKTVNIEVYMFADLLGLLEKDHAEKSADLLAESDVSFGDAEYTIVRGQSIHKLIERAYEELHEGQDHDSEPFQAARDTAMGVLPPLGADRRGWPRLVAIDG